MVVNILVNALVNVRPRKAVVFDFVHEFVIDLQVEVLELNFRLESSLPHKVLVLNVITVNHLLFEGIFFLSFLFLFVFVLALVVSVLVIDSIVKVLIIELFILSVKFSDSGIKTNDHVSVQ